ncbi:helix-turn-helix domain-containing protein [Globicatella sanguinis]|uniref:helix-turn-helix domain-containing protein n=1 Tax=Globicatella sanguinis TaxID=13076 RepID=UPI00254313DB|nr:helix-turn-helix transcriptional regulator [Globicatella sanguinis]MDK7631602.1 helix-turn-helix transcriptional regulator [Globicatella sanguinis]WIK66436.1 helix-turn-helix transcriptional regulator [Globicatella sanguinis]WKT55841.1 helix-turn-helix transcriptional regulator [Globicatella sanguinis]
MKQITLKKARTNIGLTIEEVSENTGIYSDLLIKLEKDSSDIDNDILQYLADYYGLNIDEIFLGETVSDNLEFNIIRSKNLTKAILDYVTEIQNVNEKVFSSASDDIESENLIALAYTVNREIDKISTFLSLLRDELELMELRE